MILTLRKGSEPPRTVSVDRPQVLLGKHSECDVVLGDAKVSRRHALLTEEGGKIFIEDLGSTNGTLVGGQLAKGRVPVGADEAVEIGTFVLSVKGGVAPTVGPNEVALKGDGNGASTQETAPRGAARIESRATPAKPSPAATPATAPTRIENPGTPSAASSARTAAEVAVTRIQTPEEPRVVPKATPRPAPAPRQTAPAPAFSFGPLDAFLVNDEVTGVMVNGADQIFVERRGRLEPTPARFASEKSLRQLVDEIAAEAGRTIDERRPVLDARLRDGSRVHALIPPLAVRGTYLTIRRASRDVLTSERLVANGSLGQPMIDFLRAAVAGRTGILVSGGREAGKTSLLAVLCSFFGSEERIITIEDRAELRLPQQHVLPLESQPADLDGAGEVTIRDLVRNAFRMRPDRIVVGELRGAEALDMLQAMATELAGSLSTIHADSPDEALSRLETLARLARDDLGSRAVREQIFAAVRLIVHTERDKDGKPRVTSIAEVAAMEGDRIKLGEIFARDPAAGDLVATGTVPLLRERLGRKGITVDDAWFRK